MNVPDSIFLIAGSGDYPALAISCARMAGVRRIAMAAFDGETSPALSALVDEVFPMKVGQMGKLLHAARKSSARHAIMAGQIAPSHLFNLRPDIKALLLLAKLKERNAETLFSAIASELESVGVTVLPATTFLEAHMAEIGHMAGPKLKSREIEDLAYGFKIAKETSRLDIGQTVIVKKGTVLAVEAFEGTNEAIRRGGALGKGRATMVKVSKPGQDMRFDVPVVGTKTLHVAAEAGIRAIGVEAGSTLLLDRMLVSDTANKLSITIYGL